MATAIPAQKRRTKTRTKRVSTRPALAVSTLPPNQIDLLPGTESLVCPDCDTWCPITGHQGATPKLVPHHTERAGTSGARRCIGSNRRIILDLTIPAWYELLGDAIADTVSRRATQVVRKPQMTPAPATSQVNWGVLTAAKLYRVYRTHRAQCAACRKQVTDTNGHLLGCPDGKRLATTYLQLLEDEPKNRQLREELAQERKRFDRIQAAKMPRQRAAQWAHCLPSVQRADAQRAQHPGGDAPTDGPHVPLEPLRITA